MYTPIFWITLRMTMVLTIKWHALSHVFLSENRFLCEIMFFTNGKISISFWISQALLNHVLHSQVSSVVMILTIIQQAQKIWKGTLNNLYDDLLSTYLLLWHGSIASDESVVLPSNVGTAGRTATNVSGPATLKAKMFWYKLSRYLLPC